MCTNKESEHYLEECRDIFERHGERVKGGLSLKVGNLNWFLPDKKEE